MFESCLLINVDIYETEYGIRRFFVVFENCFFVFIVFYETGSETIWFLLQFTRQEGFNLVYVAICEAGSGLS